MKTFATCLVFAATLALSSTAHAKGAICEHVQADMFSVDGMADDWESFAGTLFGSDRDARVDLKCAYDDKKLYFLLNVQDERLVRSKKGRAKSQDRVAIRLGVGKGKATKVEILPGSLRAPRKNVSVPRFVELEDSLQDQGFSVELSIPLRKVAGWTSSVPYLSGSVLYHDVDLPSDGKAQAVLGMKGMLHFSDAVATYQTFMRTAGLKNRQVKLDELADVDPGAGPERIIVGGKVVGVLGKSFSYMTLPIADAADLLSCRLVDFDGSGRHGIVTELRQHGNGGSRDVVMVWYAKGDGSFQPALTIETRKQRDGMHMSNVWSIVPRGQYRAMDGQRRQRRGRKRRYKAPPGADLLVRVGEVVGFNQQNYREAPAPDAEPILTPWGEQQSAVHFIEGTIAYGGDEGIGLPDMK